MPATCTEYDVLTDWQYRRVNPWQRNQPKLSLSPQQPTQTTLGLNPDIHDEMTCDSAMTQPILFKYVDKDIVQSMKYKFWYENATKKQTISSVNTLHKCFMYKLNCNFGNANKWLTKTCPLISNIYITPSFLAVCAIYNFRVHCLIHF